MILASLWCDILSLSGEWEETPQEAKDHWENHFGSMSILTATKTQEDVHFVPGTNKQNARLETTLVVTPVVEDWAQWFDLFSQVASAMSFACFLRQKRPLTIYLRQGTERCHQESCRSWCRKENVGALLLKHKRQPESRGCIEVNEIRQSFHLPGEVKVCLANPSGCRLGERTLVT